MRSSAVLVALSLVLASAYASATVPFRPVDLPRGSAKVTLLQNPGRLAVFGAVDTGHAREALARHALLLNATTLANSVTVLEIRDESGAFPTSAAWEKAAHELLALPNVSGVGPVFFDGDALTLPTGRVWVVFPPGTSRLIAQAGLASLGVRLDEFLEATDSIALGTPDTRSTIMDSVDRLRAASLQAEPELMRRAFPKAIPADPYFEHQWYLRNTGDNVVSVNSMSPIEGTAHADIHASEAWDISTGSPSIIVGVIDSGTDCTHPELAGKCVSPYNAISDVPNSTPPSQAEDMMAGHGTSVSGIVAAPIDGVGMVGVCPECRIAPVRLIQSGTYLSDAMMLRAFKHVVDAGASVINNSWGPAISGDYEVPVSSGELQGLKYAGTGRGGKGVLVVYASGNDGADTQYLGQLKTGLANVMGVAATTQFDTRATYSNFGKYLDVSAPSNDMYVTPAFISLEIVGRGDYNNDYTRAFGGTSAAAPVVSGVAALVFAVAPSLTAADVRGILGSTADKIDADGGMYDTFGHSVKYGLGRVNAYNALLAATHAVDPACTAPASQEDCTQHLDENCDGYVDESCATPSASGTPCASAADCGETGTWECPATGRVHLTCTYGCDDTPCPTGSTCVLGRCAPECGANKPCGSDLLVCTDDVLGICLLKCSATSECATGEICDATLHICHLDTDGLPGSPCTADECKGDQATCLSEGMGYPDGYCSHACMANAQCEDQGKCISSQFGQFCYKACSLDGDCRPGYLCQQAGPRSGTCYKHCTKDSHCRGTGLQVDAVVCDTATGRCIDTTDVDAGAEAGDAGDADFADSSDGGGEPDSEPVQEAGSDQAVPEGGGCSCRTQNTRTQGAWWALVATSLLLGSRAKRSRRQRKA